MSMILKVFDYAHWESTIIERDIPEIVIERALEIKKMSPEMASTTRFTEDSDVIGYIGQTEVIQQMHDWGFDPEYNRSYFTENNMSDEFDFFWRYERCDVKTSPTSPDFPKVYPKSRLLVKDGSQKMDRFVFAKVNIPDRKVFIAGTVSWADFYGVEAEYKKPLSKELVSEKKIHPCRYILAKDLEDFKKWVFA